MKGKNNFYFSHGIYYITILLENSILNLMKLFHFIIFNRKMLQ